MGLNNCFIFLSTARTKAIFMQVVLLESLETGGPSLHV